MLVDHIKQEVFSFQTGGCLLLYKSSAELRYFLSAISNHLYIAISMSYGWSLETNSTVDIADLILVLVYY